MYDHFRVLRIYSMISKDQKLNIICTIDECGETFYGPHTTQHPAAVISNNNKKFGFIREPEDDVNLQILTWQSSERLV